jgi:uncharacterized protein YbjQ (UPF0145 family)
MSPLFHKRSPEEKAADEAAEHERAAAAERSQQRAAESLQRIEQGHVPLAAAERMSSYAQAAGASTPNLFSSDLEVNEWSALARLGIRPITQVMGSSIYKVGWQPTYYNVPTEVRVLSDAYNECRRHALNRLLEETELCGADAVVGVRIQDGAHDWAPGAVEFVAVGTAVRLPEQLRGEQDGAVLSDLTGQEYVQLCEAGLRPVGIAAHTSIHYVPATGQTMMAQSSGGGLLGMGMGMGNAWNNQELLDFSQGVYEAREKAMGFVSAQAQQLGGSGLIGVRVNEHSRTHAVKRGTYDTQDLEVTFHVIGTVIREDPSIAAQPPGAAPIPTLFLD